MDKERKDMQETYSIYEKMGIPFAVTIELIARCNWNCIHCYLDGKKEYGLNTEIILDLLKQLKRMGIFEITFTGGEVFLRKDIYDILYICRKMGFSVVLFSNISLLDHSGVKKLKDLGISLVSTSVYSMNASVNDGITGVKGSLSMTIKNVKQLINEGIRTEIKTMIMEPNYNDYFDVRDYFISLGCLFKCDTSLMYGIESGCQKKQFQISKKHLKTILYDIDNQNGVEYIEKGENDYICKSMQSSLWIGYDGNVYPCNNMRKPMGNIINENIEIIWQKEEYKALRYAKWSECKDCISCVKRKYCVRCSGNAENETGDIFGPDPQACLLSDLRMEIMHDKEFNKKS